jgi:D-glycero-alpha-D-manno-heptose 1-phosphate guanylyltransferase
MRDAVAIILAGGLGTRLRGILGDLPKPMAPIDEKPFLEYLVALLKMQGISDIILAVGHSGKKIRDAFGNGGKFGVSMRYTMEKELLGTGGSIRLAEPLVESEDFFVLNGDTYFEVDFQELRKFHRSIGSHATIALARKEDTGRYGKVLLDRDRRIVSFDEKCRNGEAGYINGGVYVFRNSIFRDIPAARPCSLEREILPSLIGKGLHGFPVDGYFIDIGIPEDYERAKKELPLRRGL